MSSAFLATVPLPQSSAYDRRVVFLRLQECILISYPQHNRDKHHDPPAQAPKVQVQPPAQKPQVQTKNKPVPIVRTLFSPLGPSLSTECRVWN